MFDGIVVNVVKMLIEIVLVGDGVFPKSSLPHTALVTLDSRLIDRGFGAVLRSPMPREVRLNGRNPQ